MHVEESVLIPLPPEAAWDLAQDATRRPLWDLRIATYTPDAPVGTGVRVRMTVRMGLLRPQVGGVLRRWNPPTQSVMQVVESSSCLVPLGAGSWTLAPEAGGTRLTTRFTLDEKAVPRWIPRWFYRYMVQLDTRRSLRRLAHLARKMA
jgi:uncharacterized protein YndB with AHSA1/START domain